MSGHEAVYVQDSRVGRAVFARVSFAPDDLIGEILGDVIENSEYGSDYCIDLGDGQGLEPHEPFYFLNHSCEPNCEMFQCEDEDAKNPQICLYASSPIQPGDELTIDYAWPADHAIPCICAKDTCRGWIVAADELAQLE